MNNIKQIEKLYREGELFEKSDEAGVGGFWDLAGEIANELAYNAARMSKDKMAEQLQTGIYQVFQKIFVREKIYK